MFKFLSTTQMSMTSLAAAVLATAFLASCTKSPATKSSSEKINAGFNVVQDVSAIFSTRPEATTHSFFLVKLQSPPLAKFIETDPASKQRKVNPAALAAVDKEQTDLLGKLKALSGDIQVIYRYRMVINGIAIFAPTSLMEKIEALGGVSHIESAGIFDRPILPKDEIVDFGSLSKLIQKTSVEFIGGTEAHARGWRGQGLRVGVIDTGIDYTHTMFGGGGTEAAYKAINPDEPSASFPNTKVVGGMDFVGTKFDAGSPIFLNTVPKPDLNPLDEAGHGTHVAGTIAGRGDGTETYDGVAPDAELIALKVFGAKGSTGDSTVIAALEYALDPNADADLSDQLDVVNLSLGSGFGSGHILYSEAIQNLSNGGTVVVASGGNSGDVPYIVGSPGVSDEAISVAASVDNMEHNWKFRAAKFSTVDDPALLVEAIEGTIGRPLSDVAAAGTLKAALALGGIADKDFPADVAAQLQGKIALLDRGVVGFVDKVRRAQAVGSLGVVMVNNQPGPAIAMGGAATPFDIPAIMVTKEFGDRLKEALKKGEVVADLTAPELIEKPELIDTMATFSSRGPRSIDALLKPEIAAPGALIISAGVGKGHKGVKLSGTSMAAPHMAGVIALAKQAHPDLTAAELKSIVMNTAKTMNDPTGKMYPIARQGAGRVQIIKVLEAKLVTLPSSLSLGEVTVEARKTMRRLVSVRNISKTPLKLNLALAQATKGLSLSSTSDVTLDAAQSTTLDLRFTLEAGLSSEISGYVLLSDSSGEVARVPVLAIANKVSKLEASDLKIRSTSSTDNQGAVVDLTLFNKSLNAGDAYIFNLIGRDERKHDPTMDPFRLKICDLQETGYRVISKDGVPTLQIAAKLFEPMTTWDLCEVSVLIDSDGDFAPDQELAGVKQSSVPGLTGGGFASVLIDTPMAQQIRRDFEAASLAAALTPAPVLPAPSPAPTPTPPPVLNFTPAVIALSPMQAFEHSTVAIVEVPVADLKLRSSGASSGALAVRIATSQQTGSAIEPDDFLVKDPKKWKKLNVSLTGAGYVDLPETVSLNPGETKAVSFTKGAGRESLWLVYPSGEAMTGGLGKDNQSQVLRPSFNGP